MDKEKFIHYLDDFILFCFSVLVIFLPIAHTESIRAFSFGIPAGLWLIKMMIQRQWLWTRTPLDLSILLFSMVAGFSVITAVDFYYSLEEYIGEWLIGVFLFYVAVNNFRGSQLKYLLGGLLLGNLVMVSYGIYDFFYRGGSLFDYQIRAHSLHSGFQAYSTYLIMVFPYLLIAFFSVSQFLYRMGLAILIFFNFFALYITHTRGAWLAVAVLLFLTGWKFLSKKTLFLAVGAVVLLILLIIPQRIWQHHTPVSTNGAPSVNMETTQTRWEVLKFSWYQIKEHPFRMLGYGRRSFTKKFIDFYQKYKDALLWHAHNSFLDIALQTGIQGLVFFVYLLYKLLKYSYRAAQRENLPLKKYYLLATFMMVITYFCRNLSDNLFVDDAALLFWLLSGVAVSFRKG